MLESAVGGASRTHYTLLGAVGFLLLIACANVSNPPIALSTARSKEIAVRIALGASRGRIGRQRLTESLVLATCGAALGMDLSIWLIVAFLAYAPKDLLRIVEIPLD